MTPDAPTPTGCAAGADTAGLNTAGLDASGEGVARPVAALSPVVELRASWRRALAAEAVKAHVHVLAALDVRGLRRRDARDRRVRGADRQPAARRHGHGRQPHRRPARPDRGRRPRRRRHDRRVQHRHGAAHVRRDAPPGRGAGRQGGGGGHRGLRRRPGVVGRRLRARVGAAGGRRLRHGRAVPRAGRRGRPASRPWPCWAWRSARCCATRRAPSPRWWASSWCRRCSRRCSATPSAGSREHRPRPRSRR